MEKHLLILILLILLLFIGGYVYTVDWDNGWGIMVLDDCGDTSNIEDWVESYDGLNPVDNQVYVKQGNHSMALGIDASLDPVNDLGRWDNTSNLGDLSAYQHDWIYLWVYFPTLDYVSAGSVFFYYIGSVFADSLRFTLIKTDLSVGWNLIKCDLDNPSGTTGTIDWSDINFQGIRVYTTVGNTNDFTVYIDSIMFVRPIF